MTARGILESKSKAIFIKETDFYHKSVYLFIGHFHIRYICTPCGRAIMHNYTEGPMRLGDNLRDTEPPPASGNGQPYCFSAWTEVVRCWWDVVFIVMTAGLEKFKVFVERRVHIGPEASNLVIRGPFDLIIWSWLSKHVHALFPDTARQRGQDTI